MSRKELFHVIDEMCNEMRRKLDTDFEHVVIDRWTVGWQIFKPEDDDAKEGSSPSKSNVKAVATKRRMDDDDDDGNFSNYCSAGFKFGIERMRIETSYEKYKYLDIIHITSVVERKCTQLRTDIRWYDHLRPTMWKMNRTLKYARKIRVKQHALSMEKDLAKIIPDRIDNILLGGTNGKT